ncbi:MAG: 4-(cytidine 5'-diphospho)-2-C-methyl-D-erythritol kinase [Ruminococcaceae bacterium]|nr:4-(cytidine 5'-diphospho)-2-C-methyl-D-erythritol kinase [Oscillospiraceae bacterium]
MKLRANAKINLSLSVCGKREDGYHLIDTVMHSVSLYDTVFIEKADVINVACGNLPQQENIAYKAARLFFEAAGINSGCEIKIEKQIPMAAGLGGGSADAAAVLLGLDKLYNTNLSYEALCGLAVKLGADVPFFIKGGCMRSEGIGEILTPAVPLKRGCILLAKADLKPSTAEMYRRLDSQATILADTDAVLSAIENNDLLLLSQKLYNAFETVWPQSKVKAALLKTDAVAVALTGSGPTWFALYDNTDKAEAAKNTLTAQEIPCWLCYPSDVAIEFE